ncbi:hypothetical protein RhiirA4_549190 [Rhizophagus irregularis]|uniref:Uncharacterized protein n=1 Tax=Rhizophagus irregularis TaxID=588596 RepID=A0A2I1HBV8_9GLOM|nr:hypothetical protein RhiirA4_549190 [Rhizophagus irregularis]
MSRPKQQKGQCYNGRTKLIKTLYNYCFTKFSPEIMCKYVYQKHFHIITTIVIICKGVYNHSPPPPERTANGIKDDLQTLNKKMKLNKIILSKRQSNLGKLLKATEILSDIHMSVNNIGRLRYLVGKMRIFIHLAKEYLGVIHCVQTKHDLKFNS